jgi:hypothetical protein
VVVSAVGVESGAAEGGFILRDECISRVIKFDSKQESGSNEVANWG